MIHINNKDIEQKNNSVVTIGKFDGVHLGHQMLISTVKKMASARNLTGIVFSFSPHPGAFFGKGPFYTLLSSNEKGELLDKMGIDVFIEYPFDSEVAAMPPEDFVLDILFKKLKAKAIVVGEGFRFGKDHKGDSKLIEELGRAHNIEVIIVPHCKLESERVSSSQIRAYIRDNNFLKAKRLLGQPFFITGTVVEGRKIGRTIGFPTANILIDKEKLLPENGVYVTKTLYDGKIFESITSIGVNPTVEGKVKTIETFLFNFDLSIYGQEITVYFYKSLRGEKKFSGLEMLKQQIQQDVESSNDFFAGYSENTPNSSRFFLNEACAYFPCHDGIPKDEFNCMFCFCPLYAKGKDCGGDFKYIKNAKGRNVKSCEYCSFPHLADHYDDVIKKLKDN